MKGKIGKLHTCDWRGGAQVVGQETFKTSDPVSLCSVRTYVNEGVDLL